MSESVDRYVARLLVRADKIADQGGWCTDSLEATVAIARLIWEVELVTDARDELKDMNND